MIDKRLSFILRLVILITVLFSVFFRLYQLNMPDIIEDEDGHVRDAVAFYHNDPYIVPRHHTFAHTKGNMGHPFFHHYLILFSYKVFGLSNASSRLPAVIMSFLSAIVAYHLGRKMFNQKTALIAGSLYLLLPVVFRASRSAHIDNTFAAMGGLSLYYFYLYVKDRKLIYGILTGLFSALLFSSKINGFIIFAIFATFIISSLILKIQKYSRKDILPTTVGIIVFGVVFLIFNDPASYLDAIIHPADSGYNSVFTNPLSFDYPRLKGVLFYLFPWPFTIALILAIAFSIKKLLVRENLLLIIACIFFFTGFRFGLERGLMIFLIPAAVLVGKFFSDRINFKKTAHLFFLSIYFLLFTPYIIWYGFRTKPLPIPPYDRVTHYYTNRLKAFNYLNNLLQKNITVSALPSTFFFPDLNVRKGIELIPVAFRDPKTTDYLITDDFDVYQNTLKDPNYNLVLFSEYTKDMTALFRRIK